MVCVCVWQQQRSRHGSGTSMHSKRSDSVDSTTTAAAGSTAAAAARLLAVSGSLTELQLCSLQCEEPLHAQLRTSFVTLYMQYLQQPGAGFQQIQVLPTSSDASASQRYTCNAVLLQLWPLWPGVQNFSTQCV